MVSMYSPDKSLTVYCKECYLSDRFDPLSYGVDFDPGRSFFEQFREMRAPVPRIATFQTQSENSDFTVHSGKNKNCYMSSALVECENTYYSHWAFYCKDSLDLYLCHHMERCYFCTDSDKCYDSCYLENCMDLNSSGWCFDCRSCSNLLGCVGKRQVKNRILNQPASPEEVKATRKRLLSDPQFKREFEAKYAALRLEVPVRDFLERNSENVSGNYIVNSKNAHHVYNVKEVEDSRYIYEVGGLKDGMDVTHCANGEFVYEVKAVIDLTFSKFCNLTYQSSLLEYCDNCQSTKNCFGCIGLKGHSYCILNKQYLPDEYHALVARIKEHMMKTGEYGEFFPSSFSPYAYNETKAMDHYELSKEEALAQGYVWKDEDPREHLPQTCSVPHDIQDVPDSILNEILACQICGKNYRLISQELELYRSLGQAIPVHCWGCRHKQRKSTQNPRKLWQRACQSCGTNITTSYAPSRPEKVYCEACYLKVVY